MDKEAIKSGDIIDFHVLRRLFTFVKPYMGKFIVVVILTLVVAVLVALVLVGDVDATYASHWATSQPKNEKPAILTPKPLIINRI